MPEPACVAVDDWATATAHHPTYTSRRYNEAGVVIATELLVLVQLIVSTMDMPRLPPTDTMAAPEEDGDVTIPTSDKDS